MACKTLMMYGASDTKKTTQLGLIADVIFDETGRTTRLISGDSGWGPIADQVRRGVVVPLDLNSCSLPLGILAHLSKGAWPDRLGANGEVDETSLRPTTPEEWQEIGGYMVEGLYMIGSLLQRALESAQQSTGQPLAGLFTQLGIKFANSSQGTYQSIHAQTENYVRAIKSLPIDWAVFTSHEALGEDDYKKMTYGPAVVGKALVDKVGGWFESTFHLESCVYAGDIRGVRAFYETHRLKQQGLGELWWPAKMGLEPRLAARVKKLWPEGAIPLIMDEDGVYKQGVHTYVKLLYEMERERNLKAEGA